MGIWECGNAGDIVSPCESKIRQQLQPEVNLVAFLKRFPASPRNPGGTWSSMPSGSWPQLK
jgi:hypothetical protein